MFSLSQTLRILGIVTGSVVLLGIGCLTGCQAVRAGYETAPYKVIKRFGKFEVREYPPITVVETEGAPVVKEMNNNFMKLFGFITGKNETKQKIAMTTPVFMSGAISEKRTMAFVMPARLKSESVPKPEDPGLKIRELPAGRFAVLRYSGGRESHQESERLTQLQSWMATEGLKPASPPVYGYFDPPWTPPFLRRNEVMLRIENP